MSSTIDFLRINFRWIFSSLMIFALCNQGYAQEAFPDPEEIDKAYRKLSADDQVTPVKINGLDIYKIYYCSLGDPVPKYGEFTDVQLLALEEYKFKSWEKCVQLSELIQTKMISRHTNEETIIIESNVNGFTAKTIEESIDLDRAVGGRLEFTFEKYRKKYLDVELFHPDYDSKMATLDKDVRGGYVYMQLSQSSIDKITKKQKESVDLKGLDALIKYHPYNKFHESIIIYADTVRLATGLKVGDERPFVNFLKERPGSPLLSLAEKWIEYFKSAKSYWESAMKKNEMEYFESFISNFEHSKYLEEAKIKLTDAATIKYAKSTNPDTIAYYIEKYLEPNKEIKGFNKKHFETARLMMMVALEKTNIGEESSDIPLESVFKMWDQKQSMEKRLNVKYKELDLKYKGAVCDAMFSLLANANTRDAQLKFEKDFKSRFKEFETNDVVTFVLDNSTNKNGKVTVFGKNYLVNDLEKKIGDSFSTEIEHLSVTHSLKTNECVETLIWVDNKYQGLQTVNNPAGKFYEINFTSYPTYDSEIFYKNGNMAKASYYSNEGLLYTYEYENGKNITLAQLQTKIDDGDRAFNNRDYVEAMNIYEDASLNNFPQNTPQNIHLSKALQKTREKLANSSKETGYVSGLAPAYISNDYYEAEGVEYNLILWFPKGINKASIGVRRLGYEDAERFGCEGTYKLIENSSQIIFQFQSTDGTTDCTGFNSSITFTRNDYTHEIYELIWGNITFSPYSK